MTLKPIIFKENQALVDVVDYITDYTAYLQEGVTVSSATVTHTPPSGNGDSITPTVASPYVTARLGAQAVLGMHLVDVLATMSNGEKRLVRYEVQIDY